MSHAQPYFNALDLVGRALEIAVRAGEIRWIRAASPQGDPRT